MVNMPTTSQYGQLEMPHVGQYGQLEMPHVGQYGQLEMPHVGQYGQLEMPHVGLLNICSYWVAVLAVKLSSRDRWLMTCFAEY